MRNVFIICLLLLWGADSMAQGKLSFGMVSVPEVPGYGGRAYGVRCYKQPNGRYGNYECEFAALPYARVCLIDGKDTVRLTCDAKGAYFWKTNKIPDSLEFQVTAAGFGTYTVKYPAKEERKNWISLMIRYTTKALNEVTISANKIEVAIQGDTTTYPVENAFKTLEGDFVGDLLRELPGFAMENGLLTVNGKPIHRIKLNEEDCSPDAIAKSMIAEIKRMVEQEKADKKQEKSAKRK